MLERKCDRCGKYYERNVYNRFSARNPSLPMQNIRIENEMRTGSIKFYLCDKCMDKLFNFIEGDK